MSPKIKKFLVNLFIAVMVILDRFPGDEYWKD